MNINLITALFRYLFMQFHYTESWKVGGSSYYVPQPKTRGYAPRELHPCGGGQFGSHTGRSET